MGDLPRTPGDIADGELAGQTALICGATGPIGAAIATELARRGANLGIHYNANTTTAEKLRSKLGEERHVAISGDLTSQQNTTRVFDEVATILGNHPTIVVNAAYPKVPPGPVSSVRDEEIAAHLAAFRIHVNVCREAVTAMRTRGYGRIILISGALAARHFAGFALYAGVKAGLTAFSNTLALEEGAQGITVNTVAPGRIADDGPDKGGRTDELAVLPPEYAKLDELMQLRKALPQYANSHDVAELVAFLASPQASAVTGQTIYLAAGEPI